MKSFVLVVGILFVPSMAYAGDAKPFNVGQCIEILTGLTSLSYVGQQLNDGSKAPADAKQYKLGPVRMTIASDIAALTPVLTAAQQAQSGFINELPPLPAAVQDKPDTAARVDAAQTQNKLASENWQKIISQPCNVTLGRIQVTALKIGDGPDENQFPPNVLSAIIPIIDGLSN